MLVTVLSSVIIVLAIIYYSVLPTKLWHNQIPIGVRTIRPTNGSQANIYYACIPTSNPKFQKYNKDMFHVIFPQISQALIFRLPEKTPFYLNAEPKNNEVEAKRRTNIIFSHGLFASCDVYLDLISFFVNHGYCVICINHEDGTNLRVETFAGQEILYNYDVPMDIDWADISNRNEYRIQKRHQEIEAIMQYLKKTGLDSDFNVMIGHSFGGGSALYEAIVGKSDIFQAVVALDMYVAPIANHLNKQVKIPTFVIMAEEQFTMTETRHYAKDFGTIILPDLLTRIGVTDKVYLPGTVHYSFCDCLEWIPFYKFLANRVVKLTEWMHPVTAKEVIVTVIDLWIKTQKKERKLSEFREFIDSNFKEYVRL